MLDGKAYQAYFPDESAVDSSIETSASQRPLSSAFLEVLAALENEFRTILSQDPSDNSGSSA
jgi:hypothetical protein